MDSFPRRESSCCRCCRYSPPGPGAAAAAAPSVAAAATAPGPLRCCCCCCRCCCCCCCSRSLARRGWGRPRRPCTGLDLGRGAEVRENVVEIFYCNCSELATMDCSASVQPDSCCCTYLSFRYKNPFKLPFINSAFAQSGKH